MHGLPTTKPVQSLTPEQSTDDWDGIVDATINGADNLAQISSITVYTTGGAAGMSSHLIALPDVIAPVLTRPEMVPVTSYDNGTIWHVYLSSEDTTADYASSRLLGGWDESGNAITAVDPDVAEYLQPAGNVEGDAPATLALNHFMGHKPERAVQETPAENNPLPQFPADKQPYQVTVERTVITDDGFAHIRTASVPHPVRRTGHRADCALVRRLCRTRLARNTSGLLALSRMPALTTTGTPSGASTARSVRGQPSRRTGTSPCCWVRHRSASSRFLSPAIDHALFLRGQSWRVGRRYC